MALFDAPLLRQSVSPVISIFLPSTSSFLLSPSPCTPHFLQDKMHQRCHPFTAALRHRKSALCRQEGAYKTLTYRKYSWTIDLLLRGWKGQWALPQLWAANKKTDMRKNMQCAFNDHKSSYFRCKQAGKIKEYFPQYFSMVFLRETVNSLDLILAIEKIASITTNCTCNEINLINKRDCEADLRIT